MTHDLTKSKLITVLGISQSTLFRFLKDIEPELKERFPKFNRKRHLIPPKTFIWICEEYGLDEETILSRLIFHFHQTSPENIDTIRSCYGLSVSNCFAKDQ